MQMPEMLDNVNKTVKDDLTVSINKGDKLSIALPVSPYMRTKPSRNSLMASMSCVLFSPHRLSCMRRRPRKNESSISHVLTVSVHSTARSLK